MKRYENDIVYLSTEKYAICKKMWYDHDGLKCYYFPLVGLSRDYYNDVTHGYFKLRTSSINADAIQEYAKHSELDWLIELVKMSVTLTERK